MLLVMTLLSAHISAATTAYPYSSGFEVPTAPDQVDPLSEWTLQDSWSINVNYGNWRSHSGDWHLDLNPTALTIAPVSSGYTATLTNFLLVPADSVAPVVRFWHILQLDSISDYAKVEIYSALPGDDLTLPLNEANWQRFKKMSSPDSVLKYTQHIIDLSAYKGKYIKLRFRLELASTDSIPRWLIDTLRIEEDGDLDNDGILDLIDTDRDGDTFDNTHDAFPDDPTEWFDGDGDGIGDNADTDDGSQATFFDYPYFTDFEKPNEPGVVDRSYEWRARGHWNFSQAHGSWNSYSGNWHIDANPYEKVIGEVLAKYSMYMTKYMYIPADTVDPVVRYWHKLQLNSATDSATLDLYHAEPDPNGGVRVESSTLGLQVFTMQDNSSTYVQETFDLTPYKNKYIKVRYSFNVDTTSGIPGWAIDNVLVAQNIDMDGDGIPDGLDPDIDGDGINNDYEIQLGTDPQNPLDVPPDLDGDGIPDALDDDRDGDGVLNTVDVFPDDPTESSDLDNDGIGDNADPDRDGDGINNDYETQVGTDPNDPASTPVDSNGNGIPDSLENDRDGDGVLDPDDAFPDDPTEWADLDGDGIGDNADLDRDGDGIDNDYEIQVGTDPNDASSTPADLDGDGIPDLIDLDRDGDGYDNAIDLFPDDPNDWADLDGDGIGDNADPDRDGDLINDEYEIILGTDPNDPASVPPDFDNDGIPDALDDDRDGDGHH